MKISEFFQSLSNRSKPLKPPKELIKKTTKNQEDISTNSSQIYEYFPAKELVIKIDGLFLDQAREAKDESYLFFRIIKRALEKGKRFGVN